MSTLEEEIARARSDGVTDPEHFPFLLEPEQPSGRGVLLVHGFTATPQEMRPLAEHLWSNGDTVFAVRLPGHGTRPADLATRSYREWLTAVEQGHRLLTEKGLAVSGIGLSTGSLLLLDLAIDRPFSALVLLSPFLRLHHRLAPFAGLLRQLMPYQKRPLPEPGHSFYYTERPLAGIHQINLLRRRVRRKLHDISTPVLVLAGAGDKTIAPGTAAALFHELGSPHKKFHLFGEDVPHVLTTSENPRLRETLAMIDSFLNGLSICAPPDD